MFPDVDLSWTPVVRFLALVLLFVLPGYGWVTWLHGPDRFGGVVRWPLGFAWSFAVFGLVGWPFLWFQGSMAAFLAVLEPVWAGWGMLGSVVYLYSWWSQRRAAAACSGAPTPTPDELGVMKRLGLDPNRRPVPEAGAVPRDLPIETISRRRIWDACAPLLAYATLVVVLGLFWTRDDAQHHRPILLAVPLLLGIGILVSRHCWSLLGDLLEFTAADNRRAPWLWQVAAAAAVAVQAATAVLYDRAEWDDGFYLAAVLDYQHAEALNDQEPTHREGFPMPIVYRALCWELWGAVGCRLSGLGPQVLYHTVLPGLLVLLVYGAYTGLLSEWLPRRWVPLALLGLSAVHLWGISSHWTAANHLLPRVWQGKSVLLHLAVPLVVLTLSRFAARPSWGCWASLLACVLCGLALSLSAVFMIGALVGCLALALAIHSPPHRGRLLTGAALAVVPLLLAGLAVRAEVAADPAYHVRPPYAESWLRALSFHTYYGSAEVVWLLALPVLALFLGKERRAYLVTFAAILGLTFASPWGYQAVTGHLLPHLTYYRLWWLFPVGAGLGALVALSVRFLTCIVSARGWRVAAKFPLAVAVALLAATWGMPGIYVWGERNNWVGPWAEPRLAANPEKMPAGLRSLAARLAEQEASGGRILCSEETASFLTPFARDFRFVQTRPMYTRPALLNLGRSREALERQVLVGVLARGRLPENTSATDRAELLAAFPEQEVTAYFRTATGPADDVFRDLLARHEVKYVLTGPGDCADRLLLRLGYSLIADEGTYVLWQVPDPLKKGTRTFSTEKVRVPFFRAVPDC